MTPTLQARINHLCQTARSDTIDDVRNLHDELQAIRFGLETRNEFVPHELRETVAELEAAIQEDFFDNLPV